MIFPILDRACEAAGRRATIDTAAVSARRKGQGCGLLALFERANPNGHVGPATLNGIRSNWTGRAANEDVPAHHGSGVHAELRAMLRT
jgi:hypothetical protein